MTGYSTSKGAAVAFATALALELASDCIRVNCVCPGWVDTPFNGPAIDFMGGRKAQEELIKATVPMGRLATPDEIAPLFVYLASDKTSYMTAEVHRHRRRRIQLTSITGFAKGPSVVVSIDKEAQN
jgi:dihydroanticapsin dehydrogenase